MLGFLLKKKKPNDYERDKTAKMYNTVSNRGSIYIYIYIKSECYRISPTTKFAIILNKLCTYFFGESIIQLND